jgi:hypothetical protein
VSRPACVASRRDQIRLTLRSCSSGLVGQCYLLCGLGAAALLLIPPEQPAGGLPRDPDGLALAGRIPEAAQHVVRHVRPGDRGATAQVAVVGRAVGRGQATVPIGAAGPRRSG